MIETAVAIKMEIAISVKLPAAKNKLATTQISPMTPTIPPAKTIPE
jgi:hypothetical protein